MTSRVGIHPEVFRFFRELKKNNNRDWFQKNKTRYQETVRDPLLAFVSAAGPRLSKISPHLVADPRPGGSALFRIYRDVRFSKDKTPYKTHAGIRFPHTDQPDVHAPGYYLHLEPGSVFVGSGIWHPDAPTLKKIRDAIVDDPKAWKKAVSGKAFTAQCALGGESLKRPPKGYDPEHPCIEDLKRKDFIAFQEFSEAQACSNDFLGEFIGSCRAMKSFMAFTTQAVGAAW